MENKVKVAVLVSGGGTNLQALIDKEKGGVITDGKIIRVIASKEGAFALERAKNAGIDTAVAPRSRKCLRSLTHAVRRSSSSQDI